MRAVRHTQDFERIAALPRRRLTLESAARWQDVISDECRAVGATVPRRLLPWQAMLIADVLENGGGFAGLPVGFGKTDPTWLLPSLFRSERPLLIVPRPGLVDKTLDDFKRLTKSWRTPSPPPRVVSMTTLRTDAGAELIQKMNPDCVMIDEGDEWANPDAAGPRRMDRQVLADTERNMPVVVLTGTPSRKSIMGYWHLLCWCLRENAPVPMRRSEAETWALALDATLPRGVKPLYPGPLGPNRKAAREWYLRRLLETPGVVIVDGDSCDQPLTFKLRPARESAAIDAHYERFQKFGEMPGGELVTDALSRWSNDGRLGCGLYLKPDPPPPEDWKDARRALSVFVREEIAASTRTKKPLDTEGQVLRRFADHPIVEAWNRVKKTFRYNPVCVWLDSATLESAIEYINEGPGPCVLWCGCPEFGIALADLTGLHYYGEEGRNQQGGKLVHADRISPLPSIIVSWTANMKGFNLQAWKRAGFVQPPQSAKFLEQTVGRHHRQLQDKPVVITIICTSGGTYDAFEAARSEAAFAKETTSLTQKILRADISVAKPHITQSNRFRWATKGEE